MEGPIYSKTIDFSVKIVDLYQEMVRNQEFVISKQLLRAGTSIGANVHEASSAQSRRDFINKMTIALKEAKESRYWLIIVSKGKMIGRENSDLLEQNEEIIKILSKIIITTKHNLANKTDL